MDFYTFFKLLIPFSVSYTHLQYGSFTLKHNEVYSSVYTSRHPRRKRREEERNQRKRLEDAGTATRSYIPVSYTHLDVYKRQVLCMLPRMYKTATKISFFLSFSYKNKDT